MGHRVPNHKSKCSNLHGHRYEIEVGVDDKVVTTQGVSDEGMVIDFGDLKQIMMDELDTRFDHSMMMYEHDTMKPTFEILKEQGQKVNFVGFIPTAENIAEYFFKLIKYPLLEKKIKIKYVKIWETPSSTACYQE